MFDVKFDDNLYLVVQLEINFFFYTAFYPACI